jgi:hypothetical protein
MKNTIQCSGFWNFNSSTDNTYSGNLSVGNEITLTLLGCHNVPNEPFILHGITTDGKKITLLNCFISKRQMSMPGIPQVEISADYYFQGDHFDFEDFKFKKAIITFSDLHQWIDVGGFEKIDNNNNDGFYSAKYKIPNPISLFKNDHVEFSFIFSSFTSGTFPKHNLEINQKTLFEIKHQQTFNLEDFWKYLSQIKSFLTVAYFSEPGINEIYFSTDSNIEIKFMFRGQFDDKIKEKKSKYNFLFLYKDIEETSSEIFINWVNLYLTISPVIYSLEESFRARTILVENKFLNIIQGIETFHRRTRKNEKMSRDLHKKKIENILMSCPPEHKNWLKDRLNFSNEPTLHERLNELFSEIEDNLKNHLFKNSEKLIIDSKNSRNYFTHYDKSLEKKALKGVELHYLTLRLKIFLLIIVLKETGFSDEQLKKIITQGSQRLFNHLIFK